MLILRQLLTLFRSIFNKSSTVIFAIINFSFDFIMFYNFLYC
ncbi:hypothetical protein CoNPh11_CDS0220 [Staphylococcus phage S-CoN_Ph11]|nr:hypothetical protein CoNPh11_CDS0220 [Staphylococcus phage S-CoN_Ph11]